MKTAVITGAGSGIGAATAALFSSRGYSVILLGRNIKSLESVAKSLKNAFVEVCDLKKSSEVMTIGRRLAKQYEVEYVINNAGIIDRAPFVDVTEASLREQFESNLFGPMIFTQQFLPSMYERQSGAVINVASSLGLRPVAGTSVYSASKAALLNWTHTLALEAGPFRVRVNAVCPGITDTPILTGHKGALSGEQRSSLDQLHPLGRLGQPNEIAESIWYLATAPWTTGAQLVVDGGISL